MKRYFLFFLSIFIFLVSSSTVSADTFNFTRNGGIFNAYYHSSVGQAGYTAKFDWARSKWNSVSSKVEISKSSATTAGYYDDQYFVTDNPSSGIYGYCYTYARTGPSTIELVNPDNKPWTYSKVVLYQNNISNLLNFSVNSDAYIKNVALHEIGHSLSLEHTSNMGYLTTSIMTAGDSTYKNRTIVSPSNYDISQLKSIWGN